MASSSLAPADLSIHDLHAKMAVELGAKLIDVPTAKLRYGLTDAHWERLRRHPTFRAMVAEAMQNYSGEANADKRIRIKAAMAAEDSLLDVYRMVRDDSIPASARIDAHRHLSRLAKVDQPDPEKGGEKDGFHLTIVFPTGEREVKSVRPAIEHEDT